MQGIIMFIQLVKQNATKIVDEFTDDLFNDGWRFSKYLKNSEVNYVNWIANEQDELDKKFNEPYWEHKEIKHKEPHTPTIFTNCDGWRYTYEQNR
jgi:6-pyruvoyl-tetrahydropterin synthase